MIAQECLQGRVFVLGEILLDERVKSLVSTKLSTKLLYGTAVYCQVRIDEAGSAIYRGCGDTLRGSGLSKEGETAIDLLTKIMKIYSGEMPVGAIILTAHAFLAPNVVFGKHIGLLDC